MKKFTATAAVTLKVGMVEITDDQAKRRGHVLKKVKGNVYELTGQTQFKIGETFGYDGELPKVLAVDLEEVDGEQKEAEKADGADILEAMGMLEKGNDDHFTGAGIPKTKALSDIVGTDVSAKERDIAWAEFSK